MKARPVTSLDHFVRELCSDLGDIQAKIHYMRLYRILTRVVSDLKLNLMPSYKWDTFVVDDNLVVTLPESCLEPFSLDKYIRISNKDYIYPLAKSDDPSINIFEIVQKPSNAWACPQQPESVEDSGSYTVFGYTDGDRFLEAYYLNTYYGERYNYSETTFYGKWYWSKEDPGRVVIQPDYCVEAGDTVLIRYKISDPKLDLIPDDLYFMIRARVLQFFWEATNVSKSRSHFDQFRREISQYKRNKQNRVYQEYIDAFIRGYSTTNI